MPYLMGGFPDADTAAAVADAYVDAGADLIELGVPFSDPLADGPVIHDAATAALAAGADARRRARDLRAVADRVPVVPMVYANMVLARRRRAVRRRRWPTPAPPGRSSPTCRPTRASETGARRWPARASPSCRWSRRPPRPSAARRSRGGAEGFVYVVSDARATGERDELPPSLGELVAAVKADAPVPVAVGFGIGTPEQAAAVGEIADGVIIGSRLVRAAGEAGSTPRPAAPSASSSATAARRWSIGFRPMRLLIFTVVGAIVFLIAYAFGVGGTVSALIFLFVLFNGALDASRSP